MRVVQLLPGCLGEPHSRPRSSDSQPLPGRPTNSPTEHTLAQAGALSTSHPTAGQPSRTLGATWRSSEGSLLPSGQPQQHHPPSVAHGQIKAAERGTGRHPSEVSQEPRGTFKANTVCGREGRSFHESLWKTSPEPWRYCWSLALLYSFGQTLPPTHPPWVPSWGPSEVRRTP